MYFIIFFSTYNDVRFVRHLNVRGTCNNGLLHNELFFFFLRGELSV